MSDTSVTKRLEAAIARLEAALVQRCTPAADEGLQHRHSALLAEAEAALAGIDRVLAGSEAR